MKTLESIASTKITSGDTVYPTTYKTAYEAAMKMTDKQARHYAVDIGSLAKARKSQREFCGWVNRLCRLLAREFPEVEIHFPGACMSPILRKELQHMGAFQSGYFHTVIWLIEGHKITRSFAVHGGPYYARVTVEQTEYPHRGCDATLGVERVVSVDPHKTTAPALRAIKATPHSVYSK